MAIYLGGKKIPKLPNYKKAFYGLSLIWSAEIKVTFALDGGTAPSGFTASQVIEPGTITLPGKPTKDMFNFLGWDDGQGNVYPAGAKVNISQDTNFTASWKAVVVTTKTVYTYKSIPAPSGHTTKEDSWVYKYRKKEVYAQSGEERYEYLNYYYDGVYHHQKFVRSTITRQPVQAQTLIGTRTTQDGRITRRDGSYNCYVKPDEYISEWEGKNVWTYRGNNPLSLVNYKTEMRVYVGDLSSWDVGDRITITLLPSA